MTTTNAALNGHGASGYIPASLLGLAKNHPRFREALYADLKPNMAKDFKLPLTTCSNIWQFHFANKDIFGTYFKSGSSILSQPAIKAVLDNGGTMGGRGAPKDFPLYIFKGTADEIVPTIQETDALVSGYCAGGSRITYVRYAGGTHSSTQQAGADDALTFVFNILDGGAGPVACSTRTVNSE